jgi:hypothetical protein
MNRGVPIPREPTTLGGHLRRRRAQLHPGQSEASYALGVSTVTLSRWEGDKVVPTAPYHPRMVACLGIDPFKTVSVLTIDGDGFWVSLAAWHATSVFNTRGRSITS